MEHRRASRLLAAAEGERRAVASACFRLQLEPDRMVVEKVGGDFEVGVVLPIALPLDFCLPRAESGLFADPAPDPARIGPLGLREFDGDLAPRFGIAELSHLKLVSTDFELAERAGVSVVVAGVVRLRLGIRVLAYSSIRIVIVIVVVIMIVVMVMVMIVIGFAVRGRRVWFAPACAAPGPAAGDREEQSGRQEE